MTIKIDADSLLGDFKSEAEAHIEKIESAFLDTGAFANDPALMDGVFRAAHSLKGTAGFFSLDKIVAVAHALESVFSRIKSGGLSIDDKIADIALQSVDCLKDLVNNLDAPYAVNTDGILELLKSYSAPQETPETQITQKPEGSAWDIRMPFDLKKRGTDDILKGAAKRGHKAYYLKAVFDGRIGRYYGSPKGLIDDIISIGGILDTMIDGAEVDAPSPSDLAAIIMNKRAEQVAFTLELLVSSVLEPELFLIAVELDSRFVHLIPKEIIFSGESDEKPAAEAEAALAHLPAQKTDFSIRLDVSVINELMDLANEMILTRNQLLSSMSGHRKSAAGLMPVLHDASRLTSEIQEKVLRTRMQPVSVVFGKFPRIIRDMAKSLGKEIHIEILGKDAALDKYLLDALSDPITQLVKNSADHGIEKPERRAAMGKPRRGTITLDAFTRDGQAVIEVSDDGAGIDTEALKRKSLERGMASEEQLAAMTKDALLALIFEPGLSTAKQVTNVSGRGVGMDIVKTNIEKLGGSIEIESELGKGTVMRLKMPLTLSVVRTLIVTIDSVHYAVPELNVERIVRVSESVPSKRFELDNGSLALDLDGWRVPVTTMEQIDAKANGLPQTTAEDILERYTFGRTAVIKCLVLKAAGKNFALLIDDALETEETLVKPLPIYLRDCRCYSSTTVLGSGNAAMVLDAEGVMRFMEIEGAAAYKNAPDPKAMSGKADKNTRQVIVFKCSGGSYFAADADKVSRIERIDPEDIQETEIGQFVRVAEENVQVICPEDFAAVQKPDCGKSRLYLLKLRSEPAAALLAGSVIDRTDAAFKLDGSVTGGVCVSGTGVYNEKPLILLNTDEIVRSVRAGF